MKNQTWVNKLDAWCEDQKKNHQLVDIKFMLSSGENDDIKFDLERTAKAVYETLTEQRDSEKLDCRDL